MDSKKVLEYALALGPNERFLVVEGILRSLDEPFCVPPMHRWLQYGARRQKDGWSPIARGA